MRISLTNSKVKYLPPREPRGHYKSQFGQDYYLERLGLLAPDGFFIDVGCNHPVINNNTHYLEKILGWSGISIDGIDYTALYLLEREGTKFLNLLISEKEGYLDFYHVKDDDGWENQVSSVHKETLRMGKGFEASIVKRRTITFSKIEGINRLIDVCFIDVEGHELSVLRSINFEKQSPRVFVIENNNQFYRRSYLVNFLSDMGYEHIARIGTSDDIFKLKACKG